jgi:DNA-binding PadR family transcriptional regulator
MACGKRKGTPPGSHPGCDCDGRGSTLLTAYLLLLIKEKPSHGYELAERLSGDLLPAEACPDEATIYRNLRRMEKRGLLASAWDTRGMGAPRRLYRITPAGNEALISWTDYIRDKHRRLSVFLERMGDNRANHKE